MSPKSKSYIYPSIKDLLIFIGLFVVAQVFALFVVMVIKVITGVEKSEYTVMSGLDILISYILSFSIPIIGFIVYKRHKLKNAGSEIIINKENKLSNNLSSFSFPIVLCGYIAMMCMGLLFDPLINIFPESYLKYCEMFDIINGTIYIFITTIILAPVLEEVLFRGMLQSDLNNRYSIGISIFITSLVFAVVHFNIIQSVNAFFSSIILGLVYYKGRSLWNVIAIHCLNNATSMALMYFYINKKELISFKDMLNSDWLYYTIYIFCLALLIITIVMVFTISKNEKRKREYLTIVDTVGGSELVAEQREDTPL